MFVAALLRSSSSYLSLKAQHVTSAVTLAIKERGPDVKCVVVCFRAHVPAWLSSAWLRALGICISTKTGLQLVTCTRFRSSRVDRDYNIKWFYFYGGTWDPVSSAFIGSTFDRYRPDICRTDSSPVLRSSDVLIGAPRANTSSSSRIVERGAVYSCPWTSSDCQQLQFDSSGTEVSHLGMQGTATPLPFSCSVAPETEAPFPINPQQPPPAFRNRMGLSDWIISV